MNEREAILAFQTLSEILKSTELTWLLEEATDEIRQGKPQEKKIRVQSSDIAVWLPQEIESAPGKSTIFVQSVEFTALEKLDILMCAIDRAVVQPALMESEVANVLLKSGTGEERTPRSLRDFSFKFLPEDGDEGIYSSTFEARSRRKEVVEGLSTAVGRMRKEIHATGR